MTMARKTPQSNLSLETITILSAILFVASIILGSTALMIIAAALLVLRFSLHLVSFARPVTHHFRKNRNPVRYAR